MFPNKVYRNKLFYFLGDKVCRDGYLDPATDPPCVTRIDPCSSHECFNGGTHHTKEDQICGCLCHAGFTGKNQSDPLQDLPIRAVYKAVMTF